MRVEIAHKKNTTNHSCFCCKSMIKTVRGTHDDIVYFDKHYYHKQCFIDMNCIKRKCVYCKQEIVVEQENDNENVLYNKAYYHKDCFVEFCSKVKSKQRIIALKNTDQLVADANESLSQIFNSRATNLSLLDKYIADANREIEDWFIKSDVNQFLSEQYGVAHISTRIYPDYLMKVYNGTYKHSVGIKIPPQHLLDMWQAKIKMLNDIYAKNIVKGKEMSGESRLIYDLAVLVRRYNSYLEWLNKQRVLESTPATVLTLPTVVHNKKSITRQDNSENIDNLLDEIFV